MTDEMKMVLEQLRSDSDRARNAHERIEAQLSVIASRLDEVDDLADRVVKVERAAAWVRAWSAGAAAAVMAVFGALTWIMAHMPLANVIGR